MAVFQVHCDESGKLQDSKCVVFAACVFAQNEVSGFSRKWNDYLRNAGIKYLHMTDAMRCQGEFRDWANRRRDRDDLLETLGQLLVDRTAFQSLSPMDVSHFRALPSDDQKRFKDLVYAGFDALMTTLMTDAANFQKPEHRFHLIYDLSEEYSSQCLKHFNKLRRMHESYRQFFPSLTFADDQEFPPLQGADMVAYCRKEVFLKGADGCPGVVQKLIKIILDSPRSSERSMRYGHGAALGEGILEIHDEQQGL
ncbi:MAG: DUF3800 domain-containing protein [Planctomycetes bacterium]|nr:DUF3800 domain-containing protein [Planctomycetota bacterium]